MLGVVDPEYEFAAAVIDSTMRLPSSLDGAEDSRTRSGFAIYRNNFAANLIEAVAACYPTVVCRAGMESFRAVAHRYVVSEPPRSPVLLHYGETFPNFLRSLGTASSLAYLADLAELDLARVRAYHAPDAAPVGREAFADLPSENLDSLRMILHPSMSLVASRFPIVTIWEASQSGDDSIILQQWGAEAALVARPFLDVELRRLPPGGRAFIGALLRGETLAAATDAGLTQTEDFDLAMNLSVLIESDVVIDFRRAA